MDPTLIGVLLAVGALIGIAAGLLGIGGGMIAVPFMTFVFSALHFPADQIVHMAIATSLATILFTSISSVYAHHRRGAVLWPVMAKLTPGIVAGSLAGSRIASALPSRALASVFALFVAVAALQILFNRKPRSNRALPGTAGLVGAGAVIGVVSAIVGAGGAFISVPFMTWCNVRIHNSVATAASLGFPIAAAGTIGYAVAGYHQVEIPGAIGYVHVPAMLSLAGASVLTAPLGARIAHSLDTRSLKRVFAAMMFLLAGYMLYRAAAG